MSLMSPCLPEPRGVSHPVLNIAMPRGQQDQRERRDVEDPNRQDRQEAQPEPHDPDHPRDRVAVGNERKARQQDRHRERQQDRRALLLEGGDGLPHDHLLTTRAGSDRHRLPTEGEGEQNTDHRREEGGHQEQALRRTHARVSYIRMNETRQRLLAATRACVRRRGLVGATSRQITAEAGANLGAITYHFGSKDELVAEALLDDVREWVDPALVALTDAEDPAAGMLAAVQTLLATFEEQREAAPSHLEALVQAPRFPRLHQGVLALWSDLHDQLEAQLSDLKAEGTLADWVEPGPMAALLVAVANGIVLHATLDPDGMDVAALAAQFTGLLLAARP